ncbi:hypothetical protein EC988_001108, partial [Linderina pennispora]
MLAIKKQLSVRLDGKPSALHLSEANVSWSETLGGLVVLALLVVCLGFVLSTFLLATIGIGQLELRIVLL